MVLAAMVACCMSGRSEMYIVCWLSARCRRRGGVGRRPEGGLSGPPRLGGGPPPPGMGPPGMGRGRGGGPPGPPPPGSKAEARLRQEVRREERRAALFKRQVAAMEVSPTMLG